MAELKHNRLSELQVGSLSAGGIPSAPASRSTPEPAIAWESTFEPFGWEMPSAVDWITFKRALRADELPHDVSALADEWSRADQRNGALHAVEPVDLIRNVLIENANRDVALATLEGFSSAVDSVHAQVVIRRFQDEAAGGLRDMRSRSSSPTSPI